MFQIKVKSIKLPPLLVAHFYYSGYSIPAEHDIRYPQVRPCYASNGLKYTFLLYVPRDAQQD